MVFVGSGFDEQQSKLVAINVSWFSNFVRHLSTTCISCHTIHHCERRLYVIEKASVAVAAAVDEKEVIV